MKDFRKYVGLDVHKETIAVSVAEADGGEVRCLGEIANTPEALDKLVSKRSPGTRRNVCAGGAGQLKPGVS